MIKKFYNLKRYALVLVLVACNGSSNSNSKDSPTPRNPDNEPNKPTVLVACKSDSVQEILSDGRTVVSRLKANQNALVLWDVFTNRVRREIDYAFNFLDISRNGEYVLKEVSTKTFQILSILNDQITYSERLIFSYGTKPELFFTPVGDFIFSKIKIFRNKYKISMYDINNRDIIYSQNIEGFKLLDAYSYENFAYIKKEGNWGNSLTAINFKTEQEKTFNIKSGFIRSFIATLDLFLVQVRNRYFLYDNKTGDFLRSLIFDNVYAIDKETGKALTSKDGQIVVLDLKTDVVDIVLDDFSENVVLSSCILSYKRGDILCKSSKSSENIVKISLSTKEIKRVCY
jgi:hypothetical protein